MIDCLMYNLWKQQFCILICGLFYVHPMKTVNECVLFCGLFYVQAIKQKMNVNCLWFVLCTCCKNSSWMRIALWIVLCTGYKSSEWMGIALWIVLYTGYKSSEWMWFALWFIWYTAYENNNKNELLCVLFCVQAVS